MMKRATFAIANIYVPVKRRATLDPKKAQEIAESILQVGLQTPILVRQDGERFVLQATGRGHDLRIPRAGPAALVWRFRSPHHFCSESEMRTSEPKPH